MVCGVIGQTMGNVYYHVGTRSFNALDMHEVLKEVRQRAGADRKLALVWDNAAFHRARSVKELAACPEIDIRLIFNATARPDLATVGIEQAWAFFKQLYRASVDKLKATNIPYDNEGLVISVLEKLSHESACKLALKTLPAVSAGRPIDALPNERRENHRYSLLIYSPQPKFHDYIDYEPPVDDVDWEPCSAMLEAACLSDHREDAEEGDDVDDGEQI